MNTWKDNHCYKRVTFLGPDGDIREQWTRTPHPSDTPSNETELPQFFGEWVNTTKEAIDSKLLKETQSIIQKANLRAFEHMVQAAKLLEELQSDGE